MSDTQFHPRMLKLLTDEEMNLGGPYSWEPTQCNCPHCRLKRLIALARWKCECYKVRALWCCEDEEYDRKEAEKLVNASLDAKGE